MESEAQVTRAELDTSTVGAKRSVWVDLKEAFVKPSKEVGLRMKYNILNSTGPSTAWPASKVSSVYCECIVDVGSIWGSSIGWLVVC